jgi:hypothetical protein
MGMSSKAFDEVVANYNKAAKRLVAAAKKKLEMHGRNSDAAPGTSTDRPHD